MKKFTAANTGTAFVGVHTESSACSNHFTSHVSRQQFCEGGTMPSSQTKTQRLKGYFVFCSKKKKKLDYKLEVNMDFPTPDSMFP